MSSIFCKTKASKCVFPFKYEGKNHTECVARGDQPGGDTPTEGEEEEVKKWCPTKLDALGQASHWGECDLESCTEGKNLISRN